MLREKDVKELDKGFHPNILLFGSNSFGKNELGKPVPIFLNRKQRRTNKFSYRLKMTKPSRAKRNGKLVRLERFIETNIQTVRNAMADGKSLKDTFGKVKKMFFKPMFKVPITD